MNDVSTIIQDLISEFEKFPGIGPKSAARMVYYLINLPKEYSYSLSTHIKELRDQIRFCRICFNISAGELCDICKDEKRDKASICVVEEALDILAFERGGAFKGVYHVLGGAMSPVNNIGPQNIRIEELVQRIQVLDDSSIEVILATNPNMEGESTAMYIAQRLASFPKVKITRLARGLPTGADVEYADNLTLNKALENRVKFG